MVKPYYKTHLRPKGQITIPPVSKPIPSWITIEIIGESEPTPVFGTIGSFPLFELPFLMLGNTGGRGRACSGLGCMLLISGSTYSSSRFP